MRKVKELNSFYFPAENQESVMYIFDRIIDCTVDDLNKVNKSTKYKILIGDRVYTVFSHQIRNETMDISDAEKKYWFSDLLENEEFDSFVVRR